MSNESEMLVNLEFNLYHETVLQILRATYYQKLFILGFKSLNIINTLNKFAEQLTLKDFDDNHLNLKKFLELCDLFKIEYSELLDDYYKFILSDYKNTLIEFRNQNNLSKKAFAAKCNISPVHIGKFETGEAHPTRKQYIKLMKVLKNK